MNRLVAVILALVGLVSAGCASSSTTLARPDLGPGQFIYRISEEQAFSMVIDAYAHLLPKQSVDDVVVRGRRGYSADQRFALDWYTHRVLVVPAIGTDTNGREVHGYWFDISGSGSMPISGSAKHEEIRRFLEDALAATGTATRVTNLRDRNYETDGQAYLGLKRDARDVKAAWRPVRAGNVQRLEELRTLHDRGLISDEEYESKRKEILKRM